MKRTIIPAAIVMLTFLLASCEKKKCYVCTLTQETYTSPGSSIPQRATAQSTYCDWTEKDKAAFEKAGTTTVTAHSGNVTVTQVSRASCK